MTGRLQPARPPHPPPLAHAVRDGHLESTHRGHVAVCDPRGRPLAACGDVDSPVYARSAVKPFQALATTSLLRRVGLELDPRALAIACASHAGTDDHLIEAARILAEAGLTEAALRCPPDVPADLASARRYPQPARLAHNCSGKHAAFLYAHTATGGDPGDYLRRDTELARGVRDALTAMCGAEPLGPATDGCGAPAWRVSPRGLATAFARLAAGSGADGRPDPALAAVRDAMVLRPQLVGGAEAPDTRFMVAVPGLVAKRGAEGMLGAGWVVDGATFGVAVKVEDGAARAAAVTMAAVVAATGAAVPGGLRRPVVYGGEEPHGELRPSDEAQAAFAPLAR